MVLGLFLITPSQADDIRDFQIEGMSLGDSLLDYLSKEEIKKNTYDYYKNKKYTPLQFNNVSFAKIFNSIDIRYKTSDPNYLIVSLSGIISYRDKKDIEKCYSKLDEIVSDTKSLFSDSNIQFTDKFTQKFTELEDNGKSTYTSVYFEFENGDMVTVQCYNYSDEADQNHLRLGVHTNDFLNFVNNEAYN